MPQKKKQFRFKIPWISRSRAPTQRQKSPPPPPIPTTQDEGEGTPRAESQQHPRSRSPTQSPTSSVVFKSPVSSPSQSPTQPSTPTHVSSPLSSPSRKAQTQDESTHPAAPSASEQENGKTNSPLKATTTSPESETSPSVPSSPVISETQVPSPSHPENGSEPLLKVTPKESELETQGKTHQPDDANETVVMEHEAITKAVKGNANGIKHGESTQRSKTAAPASSGVVQAKDASARALREDHRKQKEARQSVERKMMMLATSSSSTGKDTKLVSPLSDPKSRNVTSTSISPENPLEPNGKEYHIPLQKGIKDEISNFVKKVATVTPTQPMDDKNFSVVTLAGENKGATMHVGSSSGKKEGSIHIHRAYKTDPEENPEVTTDSDQENSSRSSAEKDEVEKAYVNSNIQSVNNSLMLHGSVSERDPGVRVVLPQQQQQQAEPIKMPLETRRAEVNVNRAEKTGYQPVIRRRCLRGMFLEPSDDELDNPDKPRRHGCKVRCGDKGYEIM